MTRLSLVLFAVGLAGCSESSSAKQQPLEQLYFPAGITHVDAPGKTEGVLFVANANFDKRYASGTVVAIPLDDVGLPPLGAPEAGVKSLPDLKLTASQSVQIASFAGELAAQAVGGDAYRLFAPTRSEGMRMYRLKADVSGAAPVLSCVGAEGQDCVDTGASLSPREFEQTDAGVPRAPSPYGVAAAPRACVVNDDCCNGGATGCGRTCSAGACVGLDGLPFADVWVTHLSQADSPLLSGFNFRGYLVRLDSDDFTPIEASFLPIGSGGSNSVAVNGPWVYATGRILSPAPNLMRVVNRDGVVISTALESLFRVSDARGIAFSSDGKRLYVVGRVPDTLLVVNVDTSGTYPVLTFARSIPLPDAPNEVKVISRPGRGDLAVVSCTSAGSVALYDDDVGDLVSLIGGVGTQPFGLAVDARPNAARIYVSNFGDGRISVIDVPELDRPQTARLVAHLGAQQVCITRGVNSPACQATRAVTP